MCREQSVRAIYLCSKVFLLDINSRGLESCFKGRAWCDMQQPKRDSHGCSVRPPVLHLPLLDVDAQALLYWK